MIISVMLLLSERADSGNAVVTIHRRLSADVNLLFGYVTIIKPRCSGVELGWGGGAPGST